jgi:anti-anti-sigma factor
MYRGTKLVPKPDPLTRIYQVFMVPKPAAARLCISMQSMDMNWPTPEQSLEAAVSGLNVVFGFHKEPKLKLTLETRNHGDVIIVYCQGRIVFRDEAIALSRLAGEILQNTRKLVLDLSGVTAMDSAGIGELALVQTWAQDRKAELKCAGARPLVRTMLDLTNLGSVVELHSTIEEALASFREEQVCADC